jgi:hypothetical protein
MRIAEVKVIVYYYVIWVALFEWMRGRAREGQTQTPCRLILWHQDEGTWYMCAQSLPLLSSKFLTFGSYFSQFRINFDNTHTRLITAAAYV